MYVLTLLASVSLYSASQVNAELVASSTDYRMWCVGNCSPASDVQTDTVPGAVLMGEGTDTNEAFAWQIQHANGGDFVVLRSSGDDAYNDYIFDMSIAIGHKLNSVTTILFKRAKGAEEEEVLTALRNAEAVFFAGGDQGEYIEFWRDTEVQQIVQSKVNTTTIGGTSAGLAILGNWVYTAEDGSAVSDECLQDPFNKYTHYFESAFLRIPFMDSIVTDTHFVTRNRMGRMLTFMARIRSENALSVGEVSRGVGVDEHTALLLDTITGDVAAVGVGTAYVCSTDHDAELCVAETPLTFHSVSCVRMSGNKGSTYSFKSWSGDGVPYDNDITVGHLTDFPYGPADGR